MTEWIGTSNDGKMMSSAASKPHEVGLASASGCYPAQSRTMERALVAGIRVTSHASIMAPMAKFGLGASWQSKQVLVAAAVALIGQETSEASYFNSYYSHVGREFGISVVGLYRATTAGLIDVEGSGGISPCRRLPEQRRRASLYADG